MSNKKWIEEEGKHVLIFDCFYEERHIATVFLDDDGDWNYSSELLKTDSEYLHCDSLDEAKEEVENLIISHYEGKINYFTDVLNQFLE